MLQFDEEAIAQAMAYKKICQIVSDTANKQLKNSYIKTSEKPKYIKESDDSLLRNY